MMKTLVNMKNKNVIYLEDYSNALLDKALDLCEKEDPEILSETQKYVDKWIRINDYNPSKDEIQKRKNKFNIKVMPLIKNLL